MVTNTKAKVNPDIFTAAGYPPLVVAVVDAPAADAEVDSVVVPDVVDGIGRKGVTMGGPGLVNMEEVFRDDTEVDVDVSVCVCVSADVEAGACDVEAGASDVEAGDSSWVVLDKEVL